MAEALQKPSSAPNTVKVKGKFELDGKSVSGFRIEPCSFRQFAKATEAAQSDATEFAKALTRHLIKAMVTVEFKDGNSRKIAESEVPALPVKEALEITNLVGTDQRQGGEVTGGGNGIDSPLLFKLGTPIKFQTGVVKELEFRAQTFGDIEGVVALDNSVAQAVELIQKCATPLGKDITLIALPDTALDAMAAEDGIAIIRDVLPGFLG